MKKVKKKKAKAKKKKSGKLVKFKAAS